MKRTLVLSVLVSGALLGLNGCASDSGEKSEQAQKPPEKKEQPAKDTRPIEQRLSVGMTKDDVRKAVGEPKGTAVNSDGTETWSFNDAEKNFIPNYRLFGGKTHFTMVTFDKDGKVKSWSSSSQGMY